MSSSPHDVVAQGIHYVDACITCAAYNSRRDSAAPLCGLPGWPLRLRATPHEAPRPRGLRIIGCRVPTATSATTPDCRPLQNVPIQIVQPNGSPRGEDSGSNSRPVMLAVFSVPPPRLSVPGPFPSEARAECVPTRR